METRERWYGSEGWRVIAEGSEMRRGMEEKQKYELRELEDTVLKTRK